LAEVLFKSFPKQDIFAKAVFSGKYRYLMYGGAIRSGKTFLVVALTILLAKAFPGSRWAMVRKDLPTLRRNLLPVFEKLRGEFCSPVNQSTWTSKCANGSEIIFFTESIDTDPDLNRWKGLEVNGFVLEEANELRDKTFPMAQSRAGAWIIPATKDNPSPQQPPPLILLTVNPAPGWVRRVFYDPWRAGVLEAPYFFQQALVKDNPYLTKDYLDSLEFLPELEYRRYVLGDWDTVEGAAFEELANALNTHLVTGDELLRFQVKPWWSMWSSFDWGFIHPFAAAAYTLADDGTIYILDTVVGHKLLDTEQAERMVASLPPKALIECYSGTDTFARRKAHEGMAPTVAEIFAQYKIGCVPASTERIPGWQSLRRGVSLRSPNPKTGRPRVLWLDTPGNRAGIASLQSMVLDLESKNAEDVLKVDADMQGHGGDDRPDTYRYGLATRVPAGEVPVSRPSPDEYLQLGIDPNARKEGDAEIERKVLGGEFEFSPSVFEEGITHIGSQFPEDW
jgi:hypothetical protein